MSRTRLPTLRPGQPPHLRDHGRVMSLLLDSTGPLASSFGFHMWPCMGGARSVLA